VATDTDQDTDQDSDAYEDKMLAMRKAEPHYSSSPPRDLDAERFKTGRDAFREEESGPITDFLAATIPVGLIGSAAIAGAPFVAEAAGTLTDDFLVGADRMMARQASNRASGLKGAATRNLNKAKAAQAAIEPIDSLTVSQRAITNTGSPKAPFLSSMTKNQFALDDEGILRRAKRSVAVTDTPTHRAWVRTLDSAEEAIRRMPAVSKDALTNARNVLSRNVTDATQAFINADVNAKAVRAAEKALKDAHIMKGLKLFAKKTAAVAGAASGPAASAALMAFGPALISAQQMAKHGKIKPTVQTMAFRLLERSVGYRDVGDTVHAYLISNPTDAADLYAQGAITTDYNQWLQESAAHVKGEVGPVPNDADAETFE